VIFQEIWGNEVVLYYPDLYAGQTDLCGIYQGRDSIIDFKQSQISQNKTEWIEDYYLQGAMLMLQLMIVFTVQNIEQTVILICTPDLFFPKIYN
jgi:hypothetical protein